MEILLWILLATMLDGAMAFIGAFSLFVKARTFDRMVEFLVAFSAGALMAGAFVHLLAESAVPLAGAAFLYVLAGFCAFYLLEIALKWRHCHEKKCAIHPFTYLILVGDAAHNIIDGLVIAAAFIVDVPLGLVTTALVIGHEIPQELGNFGVLVYGGMTRAKALAYNFLSQITCVAGGLAGYFLSADPASVMPLLPFAAGGFIYIAASDLIPELHKEKDRGRSLKYFLTFLIGVVFMTAVKLLVGE
jgi:zinc and cadmium transporter